MYRKNKYNNVKSGKYDSKKEKQHAGYLKLLESQGYISQLKEQVKFELIPAQYNVVATRTKKGISNKKKCVEKSCSYIADFTYIDHMDGDQFTVVDTKGVRTEVYKIKRKLMLQVHGITIKEI